MSMHEKVVIITGATRGIGFACARQLAQFGAAIVMVCRDRDRAADARNEIAKVANGPKPLLLIADLFSQPSIRALAGEICSRFRRIDVLINNAGAMFSTRELTLDGFEKTFALNHLAPFLLTNLLLDLVHAAPQGRIITVGSESYSGTLDFSNLQGERRYNFFRAYAASKLCNLLFTFELARRLRESSVTVNCASPGPTRTEFGDHMAGLPSLFPKIVKRIPFLLGTPEKGAATIVQLASSAATLNAVNGKFFQRGREAKTKSVANDPVVAAQLWKVSEELCGIFGEEIRDHGKQQSFNDAHRFFRSPSQEARKRAR
jgi:NAD(P)-dependent dehydrogenase (short-subunit alcohol dehydrogenase family)